MKYILRPFVRIVLMVFTIIIVFLAIVLAAPVFILFGLDIAFNWWNIVIEWIWKVADPILED